MLQRGQLLSLPVSGLLMGMVNSLAYARLWGWPLALTAGAVLALVLCLTAAWVAYRSDGGARHLVANNVIFALFMAPMVGGGCLVLAQMTQQDDWVFVAWACGVATVLAPVLGPAWQTYKRLAAEGTAGPWARKHLDLRAGVLLPGALSAEESPRPAMAPWQVGLLAVNVPLAWRMSGGGDTALLALAVVVLSATFVWVGVKQVGPALGAAWFVLAVERRSGQRLRSPEWAGLQAMRRSHWLARWFMRDRDA